MPKAAKRGAGAGAGAGRGRGRGAGCGRGKIRGKLFTLKVELRNYTNDP